MILDKKMTVTEIVGVITAIELPVTIHDNIYKKTQPQLTSDHVVFNLPL